ncbi:MAG: SCO family protein [Thermoanaerobaculia bacterium]
MQKFFAVLLFALAACSSPELPPMYPVPEADLVDENGRAVSLASLKGNIVVYDFIFTSCTATCPIMTGAMQELTEKIDADAPVKFVSISVDPTNDTPAVLRAYAQKHRKDPRWIFLTGDRDTIVKLSVQGFKLAAGDPMPGSEPVLHSTKFVVADKGGMIREYYGATDGDAPKHVAKTVKALLKE